MRRTAAIHAKTRLRYAEQHAAEAAATLDEATPLAALMWTTTYVARQTELSATMKHAMMWMVEKHMKTLYDTCRDPAWHWNTSRKRKELFNKRSRYLILKTETTEMLVAFAHFQFVIENEMPVLYLFELHTDERYQRQGIGRRLVRAVERMARILELAKVVLTVLKHNDDAVRFYMQHIGYSVDDDDPSNIGDEVDYFILSLDLQTMNGN